MRRRRRRRAGVVDLRGGEGDVGARQPAHRADVPVISLHDARHTSVTLMRSRGWPDHLVALWHGHDESCMRAGYTHSYLDDLRRHAERRPPHR